jgi:hypothetical protein
MSEKISYEEALAGAAPAAPPKPGAITYEEATNPAPRVRYEGPLSNAPGEGEPAKAAKGTASALVKGAANILGSPGDLMSLGDLAYAGVMSLPRFIGADVPSFDERLANVQAKRAAAPVLPRPPTSQTIKETVLPVTGEYRPETAAGRVGSEALEFATSMLAPQAGVGRVGQVAAPGAELLRDAVTGAFAGAGGQGAVEALGESPAVRFLGSLAGAATPTVAQTAGRAVKPLVMPESAARDVAGKVLDQAAEDAGAARAALAKGPAQAALDLGVSPSTSQIAGDRGIDALEATMRAKDPVLKAELDAARDEGLRQTAAAGARLVPPGASGEAARTAAQTGVADAAAKVAAEIPQTTRVEASARARDFFDKALDVAKQDVDKAWTAMRESSGALFVNKTLGQIKEGFKGIDDVLERKRLTKLVDDYADEWRANGVGRDISPDMVNPLRSRLLDDARAAARAGNANQARVLNAAADSVLDAMSNKANWRFGDDSAVQLWNTARDASRNFHKTFKDDALAPLSRSTAAGAERVADGATLSRLTGGDPAQAAQNVTQFLQATGMGAAKDVFDFMYAKMTNNGTAKVTTGSIDKFLAKNGPVVDAIPGMRDHLNDLRTYASRHGALESSVGNLMFEGRDPASAAKYLLGQKDPAKAARDVLDFGRILGKNGPTYVDGVRQAVIEQMVADPAKLGTFMEKNASMLRNLFPEKNQLQTILKMREVEKTLTRAPDRSFSNLKAFEDLTQGRILDLLVGAAQGKLIGAGAGYLAGSAMAKAGVPDVGMAIELLGAALGSTATGGVGRVLYGSTGERAQQILAEALKDPKKAEMLLRRATPGAWTNMMKSFPGVALRAAETAATRTEEQP